MKKTLRKAITLVEIMVAVALTAIVGVAMFTLYRGGVQSSLTGVVNLDMLGEGRKVIAQIRDDLKHACIPYQGAFSVSFNDLLQVNFSKNRGLEGAEFVLLRFKYEPEFVRSGLPGGPEHLFRPLLSVSYRLEAAEKSDLLKLVRETNPGTSQAKAKILSERVSFFRIAPVRVDGPGTAENWFWNVSLQLGQHHESPGREKPENSNPARGNSSLSFYDVVYSDFFNAINNYRHSTRNWHTGLKHTPE